MTRFDPKKLIQVQKDKKVNNKVLAERAGVSYVYLSWIRKGKGVPSLPVASKLADGLGVPVESLYTPDEAYAVEHETVLDGVESAIIGALRTMNEPDRAAVLGFIQGLAASGSRRASEMSAEVARVLQELQERNAGTPGRGPKPGPRS